jgi:hypothetical protein
MLIAVDESSRILKCPSCGQGHDPSFRFCTKCGTPLPKPEVSPVAEKAEPSGEARGIEPTPEERYEEPLYEGGTAASTEKEVDAEIVRPPMYAGVAEEESAAEKADEEKEPEPLPPPKAGVVGLLIILSIAAPPIGLITSIVWGILPSYRKAALPALMATVIGGGMWGWVLWADMRGSMYREPYGALLKYIDAQDRVMEEEGHYMSLLELRTDGYLPADFPEGGRIEYEIVEHVLGPTGWLVEISPGEEERRIYRMHSLWSDHTGDVRMDSADGPRYQPR